VLAFGELEIVIRELGPLLFQLALGDVPVALISSLFIIVRALLLFVLIRRQCTAKVLSQSPIG